MLLGGYFAERAYLLQFDKYLLLLFFHHQKKFTTYLTYIVKFDLLFIAEIHGGLKFVVYSG